MARRRDDGEFGGELVFRTDAGETTMVLRANVQAVHQLFDGQIVATAGLSHLVSDRGSLYRIACEGTRGCQSHWWKRLPGQALSSWVAPSGELRIDTTQGSVVSTPDGVLQMADCDEPSRD